MARAEFIEITVTKWRDYNPRTDVKKPSWFRLSNALVDDPDFYTFSAEEFRAWIYVLSMCSRKNTDTVRLSYVHAEQACKVKPSALDSAIAKLSELKALSYPLRDRDGDGESTNATGQTDRTDITGQDRQDTPTRTQALRDRDATVVLAEFASLESVIRERGVTEKVQRAWLAAFPEPEWIITEVRKGLAWEAANPSRSKKNFGAFMTRWMTKGWDQRATPGRGGFNPAQARADANQEALRIALEREAARNGGQRE